MSIIAESPVINTVDAELLKWVAEITAIRAQVLGDRIASLDDPRAQQIINSDHYPMDDRGQVLAQYFAGEDPVLEQIIFLHFTDIPTCPMPLPVWADSQVVLFGDWPEITVENSRSITSGEFTIRVDQMVTVMAEASTDPDGKTLEPGYVYDDEIAPRLTISYADGYSKDFPIADLQELDFLGEAILDLSLRISDEAVSAE